MESGRFEKLPRAQLPEFVQQLRDEARLKSLDIEIVALPEGGDPVDVEWRVKPKAAAPVAPPAALMAAAAADNPAWLTIAEGEIGTKEAAGGADNPAIVEYFAWTSLGPKPDSVSWCGAFVSFCLGRAGVIPKGKGSARAADWLAFGDPLPAPRPGCIVVLKPQAPSASGHVGFWVKEAGGKIHLLGGNQADSVNVTAFPAGELREGGYRWPRGAAATVAPAAGDFALADAAVPAGTPALSADDLDILTRTLWGEARGEPEAGQAAVVHVIRNRAIRKGTDAARECQRPAQFSCWFDAQKGKLLALRTDDPLYVKLAAVARMAWDKPDTTGGALHYYAPAGMPGGKPPSWAAQGTETLRIGGHIFLKGVPW